MTKMKAGYKDKSFEASIKEQSSGIADSQRHITANIQPIPETERGDDTLEGSVVNKT